METIDNIADYANVLVESHHYFSKADKNAYGIGMMLANYKTTVQLAKYGNKTLVRKLVQGINRVDKEFDDFDIGVKKFIRLSSECIRSAIDNKEVMSVFLMGKKSPAFGRDYRYGKTLHIVYEPDNVIEWTMVTNEEQQDIIYICDDILQCFRNAYDNQKAVFVYNNISVNFSNNKCNMEIL